MGSQPIEPRHDAQRRLACRLFRVNLVSDIHERACDLGLSLPAGNGRKKRVARIAQAGLVFIHVPKAAGMSISEALYGVQVKHFSIRLGRRMEGGRLAGLPSFAVLREPFRRFLSAYHYGRAGGTENNEVAEPFRTAYQSFRSIDDALDHVEQAATPYAVDHIFRPQSWYVTDAWGRVAVDRLVALDDLARLPLLVPGFPARAIPRINKSDATDTGLTPRQRDRIRRLYATDFALWEKVASGLPVHDRAQTVANTNSNNLLPFPTPATI